MRTVNREILEQWLDINRPNGLARLSVESGLSASTISYARKGIPPRRDRSRIRLARAVGVVEDVLFPIEGMPDPAA